MELQLQTKLSNLIYLRYMLSLMEDSYHQNKVSKHNRLLELTILQQSTYVSLYTSDKINSAYH